jgi:siroheme synthase (precorrin-2 oxidase/ferrochelatase)
LKAKLRLCRVEAPSIQTYRHFLTYIAICDDVGEVPLSEIPAELAKALDKNSEVVIPCTEAERLSESIARHCKDREKERFYLRLSII